MKDQAVREKFVELRARGWSYYKISKDLEVSRQCLIGWSRDLTLEIRNRRAIEHEALLEQYALTHEARIQYLGELLKKVREELAGRSLDKVSTERLLDLSLRIGQEWHGASSELTLEVEEDPIVSMNKSLTTTLTRWSA